MRANAPLKLVFGPLFVAAVALGLVLAAVVQPQGVPSARAQKAPPSSASCETCHAGIEEMHPGVQLTCTECHGGNGAETEKDRAHVLPRNRKVFKDAANPPNAYGQINHESPEYVRFANPSDLRIADQTCGECHMKQVDAVRRSVMATNPVVFHAGLYNNGHEPSRIPTYGEAFAPVEKNGKTSYAPARIRTLTELTPKDIASGVVAELWPMPKWEITVPTDHFRVLERGNVGASTRARGTEFKVSGVYLTVQKTRLNDPGLWLMGPNEVGGDFRQSGCAACHVPYANDGEAANSAHLAEFGNKGFSFSGDKAIPKNKPGHPIKHAMTRQVPSSQCMSCHHHQGNGALGMYQGYLWWDQESDYDKVVKLGMGYPWWDPKRKEAGVDPPYPPALGADGTPKMTDLHKHNSEMRDVQFGQAHGHNWHFVKVFKRDRYGRLLDTENATVPDSDPRRFEKAVHLKDIHLEKGMQCIDCHGTGDVHGGGEPKLFSQMRDVIEIRCETCHGTATTRATLKTTGPGGEKDLTRQQTTFGKRWMERKGDTVVQNSKMVEGLSWEVKQVADSVTPGHPRYNEKAARAMGLMKDGTIGRPTDQTKMAHSPAAMECQSCHGSWNSGCWGCHLSVRFNTKAKELHVGDDDTRGYTDYYPQLLRADNNMMGIAGLRQGNKFSQVRPANPVFVTVQDRGRNTAVHEQPTISSPGYSGFAYTPNPPHTVRGRETKDCEDCHVSRANDNNAWMAGVLGFGNNAANFVGDYVYIAEGAKGVRAVRVADGYEPRPVIGSWLHSVAYPDDFKKFVAGWRVLKESHRASSTMARSVARRGEFLLVADGAGGLRAYDIALVANKSVAQRLVPVAFSPLGNTMSVDSKDATAVALAANNPMDLDRKSRPENHEQPIAPVFRYAYMTDRVEGLIVVDINTLTDGDPTNNYLKRAATFDAEGRLAGAVNLTIAGNYAYVVSATTGLHVVDISTPTAPRLVASIGAPAIRDPRAVQVQFRYAFVVDAEGMKVIDITAPERPRVTPGRVALGDARGLYLLRTYAYIAAGRDGLAIVDIERPEAPGAPTLYNPGGQLGDANSLTIGATYAGQYAYVAAGQKGIRVVKLIDTKTPGYLGWSPTPQPELIASLPTSGAALGIAEGYRRDRAADESGNQIGIGNRLGSRPFNATDLARFLKRNDELINVENSTPRSKR